MIDFCWFMFGVAAASIVWLLIYRNNAQKFSALADCYERTITELKKKLPSLIVVIALALVLSGPSLACDNDCDSWLDHSTIYASGAHWWFSVWGYRDADPQDWQRSWAEGWWGCPVYHPRMSIILR